MPFLIGPLLASFTCVVNIVIDPTTTGKIPNTEFLYPI